MARTVAGSMVVSLVLFHLRLLWHRLVDQSVLEPGVALKWLVSVLLMVALWRLRIRGRRLLTGRRAIVVWLVALLLHVQLPVLPASEIATAVDLGWVLALPAGVSVGAAVALTLGLAFAAFQSTIVRPAETTFRLGKRRLGGPRLRSLPALACRPPPALS